MIQRHYIVLTNMIATLYRKEAPFNGIILQGGTIQWHYIARENIISLLYDNGGTT